MKYNLKRMPEWSKHKATWLAWPHNSDDWPGKMAAVDFVFAEIVRHIVSGEQVCIIIQSESQKLKVRRILRDTAVDLTSVRFHIVKTDRSWIRDFGPVFLKDTVSDETVVCNFKFNSWARYKEWQKDDLAAKKLAAELNMPVINPFINDDHKDRFVLEGGAFDVNGTGSLITTAECLLDENIQVRNPGVTKSEYEDILRKYLGVTSILWLDKGILGDDTHGHVDDLCRFVSRDTVVLCQEKNPLDENYINLKENKELLSIMKLEDGSSINCIDIPVPEPVYYKGVRLPASYANFYIANNVVLVPTFNDPNDREALGIISDLFPDRKTAGIHSVDLVWGLGTIHCLTNQQPE
ncbi:MAG: agmatine deiminase family protein [bacterium]|nr:agmatine deiminase family protein [bacterium]